MRTVIAKALTRQIAGSLRPASDQAAGRIRRILWGTAGCCFVLVSTSCGGSVDSPESTVTEAEVESVSQSSPSTSAGPVAREVECRELVDKALGLARPLPDGLGEPRCATEAATTWVTYPPRTLARGTYDRSGWETEGGISIGIGIAVPGAESSDKVPVRGAEGLISTEQGSTVLSWLDPNFGPAVLMTSLDANSVELFVELIAPLAQDCCG